ncbi:rhamnulokinase [Schaalia sp. ZJ405]|uniref:rhamnulokinase n=1 Tax=Schaalia sp. ZJ405 TaxID=2709403 RepID=UPI0013EC7018|nr:rhamnulokinase family protein [Schaalia sp. ZJ405]QPK81246.1 rhamnulokinase [Schaalia sp. ZJ405]
MSFTVVAIDLGASSGRVLRGVFTDGCLVVEECSRFHNGPVLVPVNGVGDYEWDILALWRGIREGLTEAARRGPVDAIGIDSWAVDYGLVDDEGRLVGNPASYRSKRTANAVNRVFESMDADELYRLNGLQFQPFNTMFQLIADRDQGRSSRGTRMLMIPDLLGYWLTNRHVCEVTNASTTGMVDPRTRTWSTGVGDVLRSNFGVDTASLLPELVEPGTIIGPVRVEDIDLRTREGNPTPLVAVGSHDTASAVVAVPAVEDDSAADLTVKLSDPGSPAASADHSAPAQPTFGFISSGTWSLVGMELDEPVLSQASRSANFTNELGVDGTVRYLKNIMGMWVQQECLRQWRSQGMAQMSWPVLDAETEASDPMRTLFDINDSSFLTPGDMCGRISRWCEEHGEPVPQTRAQVLRSITESLVVAYRRALREAESLSGRSLDVIHIVGGGSKNVLLCQSTADATGRRVIAGPVEGTAVGNMVVQLRAVGAISGGLDALRRVVVNSTDLVRYEPRPTEYETWEAAERRVFGDR